MVLKNETPATAVDILSLATSLLKARKTSAGQHALAVATDRAKNLADVRVIVDACLANREYASSVRALERAVQLGAPDAERK